MEHLSNPRNHQVKQQTPPPLRTGVEQRVHSLVFKSATNKATVQFALRDDYPELVYIRSQYWRAEDEFGGWYSKQDARTVYKTLVAAGYVAF